VFLGGGSCYFQGYFLRKWHFSWGLHSEKEPAMGKEEEKSSG
jgi:hypothetical protein